MVFELYRQLRNREETAETPVIFISAITDGEAIEQVFALGAVDYISKPFRPNEVVGRVKTHLRLHVLRQSLASAAILFEQSSDGVILTDPQGNIRQVNPAFSEITGFSQAEVVGQNPRLLQSGRHDAAFYATLWAQLLEQGQWSGEIWNRRKDGSVYPQWTRILALRGEQGGLLGYLAQFSDISRRKQDEQDLNFRLNHDALTGLANRNLLFERLRQGIKVHQRSGRKLCLLFLDLDRFKQVNDSLGHHQGDLLLQQVAARIREQIRDMDTAARLSGDEFVVLMVDQLDALPCERVASRLVESLARPFDLDGERVQIGASIGVAFYPEDGSTQEVLCRNADLAMYQAKEAGRNQAQFFTEAMEREYLRRRRLEADLRQAIARGELLLHYQPIVDTRSGRPMGVESLLRWRHPEFGLVAPAEFIPIAEEAGLIGEIGAWVFERVCHQLGQWRAQGLDVHVAINLSSAQLPLALPLDWVQGVLAAEQLPAERIILEISEDQLVRKARPVVEWLRDARERGFRIYLDNFDMDSSLSLLNRLEVDAVKIDRAFFPEQAGDSRDGGGRAAPGAAAGDSRDGGGRAAPGAAAGDAKMGRVLVLMSKALGMTLVGERIETTGQLERLREIDCPYVQGYLIAEPVPAEQVADLLRALAGPEAGG
jgi:diguanylate cyclase (GGDEF)-like protein/PAS domain S-box-containing protein